MDRQRDLACCLRAQLLSRQHDTELTPPGRGRGGAGQRRVLPRFNDLDNLFRVLELILPCLEIRLRPPVALFSFCKHFRCPVELGLCVPNPFLFARIIVRQSIGCLQLALSALRVRLRRVEGLVRVLQLLLRLFDRCLALRHDFRCDSEGLLVGNQIG